MTASKPFLFDAARRELEQDSAIDPAVIAERGYESIHRPTNGDQRQRERLRSLQIPTWAIKEDSYFPGLLIPMFGPTGSRVSAQWKPRMSVPNRDGKKQKYASPKGQTSRLDVHPRNRSAIVDPTAELWITEGIKKGDALTSRGVCAISLTGVFNWRSQLGTLGDWEDVILKGRSVVICFDADARTNRNVLRAMLRLGQWLKSKGVKKINYLIVPAEVNGTKVKGADDFFAAGGTLEALKAAVTTTPPNPDTADDTFSDARLAETIADDVLTDRFIWVSGIKAWMMWDGRRWAECSDVTVGEAVRQYSLEKFSEALAEARATAGQAGNTNAVDGWRSMLSAGRERSVLSLARGIVERQVTDLDRDLDLLNTPSGVVDLTTGELLPHDPALFITKIAGAEYRPGFTHPDWDKALEAVPADIQDWYQLRLGQAITGHMTPDDLLVVSQGSGENGKSTVNETTARAVGDYFLMASDRILLANPDQHPTELMDLQGVRYAVAEETPEARRLAVTRLKKTIGTPRITARRVHKDDVTFDATHSFFLSTNYKPIVEETDHGTWRRLALVKFPYTFRKPHEKLTADTDRRGDPTLRGRCSTDPDVWAAALAWMVEGARRWYAAGKVMPEPPARVAADTREWRVDSDQVLAYLDEQLVFDSGWHVMALDLLDDVNAWLTSRGHRPWSDKTLAARFGEHDEVIRKGVEKRKVRKSDKLSRPPATVAEPEPGFEPVGVRDVPAGLYAAWLGVRFATREDAEKGDEKGATEDTPDKGNREPVPGDPAEDKPVSRGAKLGVSKQPEQPEQEPERPAPSATNVRQPSGHCPLCDRPLALPNPSCSMRPYHGEAAS